MRLLHWSTISSSLTLDRWHQREKKKEILWLKALRIPSHSLSTIHKSQGSECCYATEDFSAVGDQQQSFTIHSTLDTQVGGKVWQLTTCCREVADDRMINYCCYRMFDFWHLIRILTFVKLLIWACCSKSQIWDWHVPMSSIYLCVHPSYPPQLWSSPSSLSVVPPAEIFPLLVAALQAGPACPTLRPFSSPPLLWPSDGPEDKYRGTFVSGDSRKVQWMVDIWRWELGNLSKQHKAECYINLSNFHTDHLYATLLVYTEPNKASIEPLQCVILDSMFLFRLQRCDDAVPLFHFPFETDVDSLLAHRWTIL